MSDPSEILDNLPLVRMLSDDDRRRVLSGGHRRRLAKGEVLFHEGDPAGGLFVRVAALRSGFEFPGLGLGVLAERDLFGEERPAADRKGTGRAAFIHAIALLPITGALAAVGVTGMTYLVGSQFVGLAFAALGWSFARHRVRLNARRLFIASIIYLPVLLGLMVADMDDRIARLAGLHRAESQHITDITRDESAASLESRLPAADR